MHHLPMGTITLLFADMEGSTRLLQQLDKSYTGVLADYRLLFRAAFGQWHGYEIDTQGDAFFAAFTRATDAVSAALAIQRNLASHPWCDGVTVRARIGLHTCEPVLTSEGYIGVDVHYAARIMAAGYGGQILLSQTTCDLVELHLPDGVSLQDLGEHSLKDLQHKRHLFQLVSSDLLTGFPPLKTLDSHPNNLPIQPTTFIGREKQIAQICGLLRRQDVRLVTLSGPGGVGKTRLGLQVAAELSDQFTDGVFLVSLATLSDSKQVVPTIRQTLAIDQTTADQSMLEGLVEGLKEKHLLLFLDNFEQVTAAALIVADLLAACPRLKILVTSRVVLHVRAEHEFAVHPLAVPNLEQLPDLVTLSHYEAVTLFIERAQAAVPTFEVTNTNAPAVAAICARLDGLPLAIELAAARIKYFQPQALLARLEQGLAFLSGGARDLPVRQQTLRGTIAWSYDLLTAQEQLLFRRLSVFVGSCDLEAAEQVSMAAGEYEDDILEGLASLVDKSLLRQEEQAKDQPRFWMLQTLRAFAVEYLDNTGETQPTRHAHALYYLAQAEEAERHLNGIEQTNWHTRLEQEKENLRAALDWLLEQASMEKDTLQFERALRSCAPLILVLTHPRLSHPEEDFPGVISADPGERG
jgi:predicted ATPase/class 3 adenylate cyclase